MEGDSSRGGSARGGPNKRFQKPRNKNVQIPQNQSFQPTGYHPQPSSPHFNPQNYSYNQSFDHQQFQNAFEQFDPSSQQSFQQFANQTFPTFNQSPSPSNVQDYRKVDDSNSSEPRNNPPPPLPKQTKAQVRRWAPTEEVALSTTFLIHSKNSELGNRMKRDVFTNWLPKSFMK